MWRYHDAFLVKNRMTGGTVSKAPVLDEVGILTNFECWENWDLGSVLERYEIDFVNEPLVNYRFTSATCPRVRHSIGARQILSIWVSFPYLHI